MLSTVYGLPGWQDDGGRVGIFLLNCGQELRVCLRHQAPFKRYLDIGNVAWHKGKVPFSMVKISAAHSDTRRDLCLLLPVGVVGSACRGPYLPSS